jgi:uncharacterized protein YacL
MRAEPGPWLGAAAGAFVGFHVSLAWLAGLSRTYPVSPTLTGTEAAAAVLGLSLGGAAVGWWFGPRWASLAVVALRRLGQRLFHLPAVDVLSGAVGVVFGLLVGFLFSPPLARLPWVGAYLPVLVSLGLAWLGGALFASRREEWLRLLGASRPEEGPSPSPPSAAGGPRPKVLDTSAIIDGRIADLYRTGFLEGDFVVANFVLDELRHIADSADPTRRQRGRHGLQVLATLQKELGAPVVFVDREPDPNREVDVSLVLLAQELGAHVVTTDYNLNKVAELQGVPVLNVNELAGVLRPRYLRGDSLAVRIVADGKQAGQGVGYLEDGTMVVVEGGRRFMNGEVDIEVTSSYQTAQGRMIFGRPRAEHLEQVGPP